MFFRKGKDKFKNKLKIISNYLKTLSMKQTPGQKPLRKTSVRFDFINFKIFGTVKASYKWFRDNLGKKYWKYMWWTKN